MKIRNRTGKRRRKIKTGVLKWILKCAGCGLMFFLLFFAPFWVLRNIFENEHITFYGGLAFIWFVYRLGEWWGPKRGYPGSRLAAKENRKTDEGVPSRVDL